MRVLVTGSSGPNRHESRTRRPQEDGHWVFGVDKRVNTWTRESEHPPTRISRATTRRSKAGSRASSTPRSTSWCTWRRTRRCISSSASDGALGNANMTFNVLEYRRELPLPLVFSSTREVSATCTASTSTARPRPTSPSPRARTPRRRSPPRRSSTSYARRYGLKYLVFRFSNVYGVTKANERDGSARRRSSPHQMMCA